LLTLVMVLDCLILILLVLIQLPKKDAGAGLAFGGGATDALFGAGSGTVLTKITKYAAGGFFVLAVILSVLQINYHRGRGSQFSRDIERAGQMVPPTAPAAPSPALTTNFAVSSSSTNTLPPPQAEATGNVPAVAIPPATTNPPGSPPAAK
jgi:preprotein translocase subunit SecG